MGNATALFDGSKFIINDDNINIFKIIFLKCPNIKSIDFRSTNVTGGNNSIMIGKLCPKLEHINLSNSTIDVTEQEFDEFFRIIESQ